MKRTPLKTWDREVAPFLQVICLRSKSVASNTRQIREWIYSLKVVPNFETEARERLNIIRTEIVAALQAIDDAIKEYDTKERTA